ncbi:hypothetical protein NA78x_001589 [Anatilimnocola sp. NA78]|uniref:hypothetical protein n=1 Tax=Anatilimnocola sp. NA78 TaxID=3415683 RepID=UPI003CE462D4
MRLPISFLVGFAVCLLFMLGQTWIPNLPSYAVQASLMVCVLGSLVWLLLQLVSETVGQFKTTQGKIVALATLLALFALTAALSAMYFWVVMVTLVLFGCVMWRGFCDYAELFRRRPPVAGPVDWAVLENGQLPRSDKATHDRVKAKFSHSCEIRGRCVPRVGRYGLISHPLQMDE